MAKRLTDKKRKQIIADYVDCKNYSEVARKHKVSATIVKRIVVSNPESTKMFEQKEDEITNEVLNHMEAQAEKKIKVLDAILSGMLEKAENVDMFTNIKDLATAYGILMDKEFKPIEIGLRKQEVALKEKMISGEDMERLISDTKEILVKVRGAADTDDEH